MSESDQFVVIRDYMIQDIINKHQNPDNSLPSENKLAEFFKISRSQMRLIYQQLVELGYVQSVQGVGYFVRKPLPSIDLLITGSQSFSEKMLEQGLNYRSEQSLLGESQDYYIFQRLRYIEEIPMALHTSFLSKELFPNFMSEIGTETSLFNYLRRQGYQRFKSGNTTMEMTIPNQVEQDKRQCGSLVPLILLKSACIDCQTDTILEHSKTLYRGDIIKFQLSS